MVAMEWALVVPPSAPLTKPAPEATFHWHVRPSDRLLLARFYSDGSALDGPAYELSRCGWAFVAVDERGRTVAAAYGATPPWIRDIGGAEGWAILQAVMVASPGSTFVTDCKVIADTIQLGRHAAVGAGSTHARINALLFSALDDTPTECLVWMPAHQGKAAVRTKSDGTPLTQMDIEVNDAVYPMGVAAVLR